MRRSRDNHGLVAITGGLLAMGGAVDDEGNPPDELFDELFDEASGRWFELPHPMAEPRQQAAVVSLPAAALAAGAPAAAAAPGGA